MRSYHRHEFASLNVHFIPIDVANFRLEIRIGFRLAFHRGLGTVPPIGERDSAVSTRWRKAHTLERVGNGEGTSAVEAVLARKFEAEEQRH